MPRLLRKNGARDLLGKELRVFKGLVKSGHTDEQIGCMLGRTTRGVRGLRDYYNLTNPERYKTTGSKYTPAESEEVNALLWKWVVVSKLTSKEMAAQLKVHHPPGLHFATILTRLKSMDPSGYLWEKHCDNDKERRGRILAKRHKTAGCRTQKRDRGKFLPREKTK